MYYIKQVLFTDRKKSFPLFHFENLHDSLSMKRETSSDGVEFVDIYEYNTSFVEAQREKTIMDGIECLPK